MRTSRTLSASEPRRSAANFFHHAHEAASAAVAAFDQADHDLADVVKPVVDVGRVLAAELYDLDRVPNDVILADGLKPEHLDAKRAAPDLRVPDRNPRGKSLTGDLRPAG